MEINTYAIDTASTTHIALIAYVTWATAFGVSAIVVARWSWRAWWLVVIATCVLPTVATWFFGARPDMAWRYFPEAVLPLTLLGAPGAVSGVLVGVSLRSWRSRRR